MRALPLDGQCMKARVDLRGKRRGLVVRGEDVRGLLTLGPRVEGAGRKQVHIQGRALYVPVDVRSGGEIYGPGLHPPLEPRRDEFARISGVAWGQWLKDVEGAEVARGPEYERNDRQEARAENVPPGTGAS